MLRALIAASEHEVSLDLASRAHALIAARRDPGVPGVPLLVDSRLHSLGQLDLAEHAADVPVVLILSAVGLLDRPSEALRLVGAARAQGWEIGLRDIGVDLQGLGAVSVIEPAVMILCPSVLADPTSPLAVETLQITTAFSHYSGGHVMVENLTDAAGERSARALGVTIASGPYGPRPLDGPDADEPLLETFTPPMPVPTLSPYGLAAKRHRPREITKDLLLVLSRELERSAASAGESTVVLAAFQEAEHFVDQPAQARYEHFARQRALVMVAAQGLVARSIPGLSLAVLDATDPLNREWIVLVLGPALAVMLAAQDQRQPFIEQRERQFEYVLTYDRDLIAHAARSMLTRLTVR